ncbi:MAG: rRNA maturation RNase YbeY [Rhodospirillaceae bacterium]|nr:rRNA maturation RNase YbeY [Rhodospirillaceae bacterium]
MKCPPNKVTDCLTKSVTIDVSSDCRAWHQAEDNIQNICVETSRAVFDYLDYTLESKNVIISILLSDDETMRGLNKLYRDKDRPTNVLSFSSGGPRVSGVPFLLGDIVLSFSTIRAESSKSTKPFLHHFQHLLVHGCLHLLGFNHENTPDAERMEFFEAVILQNLGVSDPYKT